MAGIENADNKSVDYKFPKVWVGYIFALIISIQKGLPLMEEQRFQATYLTNIIYLVSVGYWIFCVFRIHDILRRATLCKYHIREAEAAFYHLIPFYNIYWIIKWPIELSKYLRGRGNVRIIPGLYLGLGLLISSIASLYYTGIGLAIMYTIIFYIANKLKNDIELSKGEIIDDVGYEQKGQPSFDNSDINAKRPTIITIICIFSFASIAFTTLLAVPFYWAAGIRYITFIITANIVGLICMLAYWKMKKWGVILYAISVVAGQVIAYFVVPMPFTAALHIEVISRLLGVVYGIFVFVIGVIYFKNMKW